MSAKAKMLALVTDAFGGRGGIAQYNRDFLSAAVLGGHLVDHRADKARTRSRFPPEAIVQLSPTSGRISYSLAAIKAAASQSFDVVFCGHLYMAPLAAFIARRANAKLIVQMHGIEAWTRPTGTAGRRRVRNSSPLRLAIHPRSSLSWAAIEPERVMVLPNTIREAFTPGTPLLAARGGALRTGACWLRWGALTRANATKAMTW